MLFISLQKAFSLLNLQKVFSFFNLQKVFSFFSFCESFLESNSPDILALCEANLHGFDSGNFSVISSSNPKGFYYSFAWSCSLCERRTSFCTGLISRKLYRFLLMSSTSFTSLSVLLLFHLSITIFGFIHGLLFYFI